MADVIVNPLTLDEAERMMLAHPDRLGVLYRDGYVKNKSYQQHVTDLQGKRGFKGDDRNRTGGAFRSLAYRRNVLVCRRFLQTTEGRGWPRTS